MKTNLIVLFCVLLFSCSSTKPTKPTPYVSEIWEGGMMRTGNGCKGGGYDYVQITLYDDETFQASGLFGSLTRPLSRISGDGTWATRATNVFLIFPGGAEAEITKAFYMPNPQYTIQRVYQQQTNKKVTPTVESAAPWKPPF